jgi:hypothetical protein
VQIKACYAVLSVWLLVLSAVLEGCTHSVETQSPEGSPPSATEQPGAQVEYSDPEFGFSFLLPSTWEGFSIRTSDWEGSKSAEEGDVVVEQGPLICIVHPASTAQRPRQEIPVMVFTIEQWDSLQQDEWHIGAAPIGPLELGRNGHYVFALPARYNYGFPEGWEEVEQILQSCPLVAFEPTVVP